MIAAYSFTANGCHILHECIQQLLTHVSYMIVIECPMPKTQCSILDPQRSMLDTQCQLKTCCDCCLQTRPVDACLISVTLTLYIIFDIGPPISMGTDKYDIPLQEVATIAAGVGSVAAIIACLVIPCLPTRLIARGPSKLRLKRMNLLGLVCSTSMDHANAACDMPYVHGVADGFYKHMHCLFVHHHGACN